MKQDLKDLLHLAGIALGCVATVAALIFILWAADAAGIPM